MAFGNFSFKVPDSRFVKRNEKNKRRAWAEVRGKKKRARKRGWKIQVRRTKVVEKKAQGL